jgi:hypothetical protein
MARYLSHLALVYHPSKTIEEMLDHALDSAKNADPDLTKDGFQRLLEMRVIDVLKAKV